MQHDDNTTAVIQPSEAVDEDTYIHSSMMRMQHEDGTLKTLILRRGQVRFLLCVAAALPKSGWTRLLLHCQVLLYSCRSELVDLGAAKKNTCHMI